VVAAVDLLEQAGYSCEVNMFMRSNGTFRSEPRGCFQFCPIKEAGTDLNVESLTNSLSAWFFRNVMIGAMHISGSTVIGHGYANIDPSPFTEHMNMESGCIPIQMETVHSQKTAVEAVTRLIEKVTAETEG
jgi:hypothetical protein